MLGLETCLWASNSARISNPLLMNRSRCTAQFCRHLSPCLYSRFTRTTCAELLMSSRGLLGLRALLALRKL